MTPSETFQAFLPLQHNPLALYCLTITKRVLWSDFVNRDLEICLSPGFSTESPPNIHTKYKTSFSVSRTKMIKILTSMLFIRMQCCKSTFYWVATTRIHTSDFDRLAYIPVIGGHVVCSSFDIKMITKDTPNVVLFKRHFR